MTTGAEQVDTKAKGQSRVSSAHRVVRIDCMYTAISRKVVGKSARDHG